MDASTLKRDGKPDIRYRHSAARQPATLPAVLFCGGYRSDMTGTKALYLEERCRAEGREFMRFDYRAHGQSAGRFDDCGIGDWTDDALAVLDRMDDGPVIVVGSSMGGWIALRLALMRPDRVRGLLGLAAAPDFTAEIEAGLSDDQRRILARDGQIEIPGAPGGQSLVVTARLLEDGGDQCVLDGPLKLDIPMRLVHGRMDREVPWRIVDKIAARVAPPASVAVTFIEDGEHRLSRDSDLDLIGRELSALTAQLLSAA